MAAISTERLWELLSDRLRGFFVRRVGDPQSAEDLLQETFVRIHSRLDGLDDELRFESWVFQIARNLLVDHRRAESAGARFGVAVEAVVDVPDATGDDNLNAVVRSWLPRMIDELPEPYAHAVRLYELEGVSQQEVADRVGISLSGAKSRIQRGREKLKSMLFDCCSFERDRCGNVIGYARNAGGDGKPRRPRD